MNSKIDPMGRAIADYHKIGTADRLRVFSPMFEEDEIPLQTLFRKYEDMPEIERKALDMAKGKTLDVGAGSGCHSLVLQEKGIDVTAIDISPLSVETMKERGIKKVMEQDFLYDGMERVLCPRVHFKLIIIDSSIAYVGSANLTGAGMGMKSPKKRNFEAGILTDDPEMLDAAIEQFDNVWIGKFCKDCGRREYCSDPIK